MHVDVAEVKALDGGAEAVYRFTYEVEGRAQALLRRRSRLPVLH